MCNFLEKIKTIISKCKIAFDTTEKTTESEQCQISVDKTMGFEQYKIAVDAAEKTTDRRNQLNTLYMAVVSLILTAIALTFPDKENVRNAIYIPFFQFSLTLFGVFMTFVWIKHMAYYKKMIKLKFTALTELETYLNLIPLYKNKDRVRETISVNGKVVNNSDIEKSIPLSFCLIFLCFADYLLTTNILNSLTKPYNYILLIIPIIFILIFLYLYKYEAKINKASKITQNNDKDEDKLIKELLNFKNF